MPELILEEDKLDKIQAIEKPDSIQQSMNINLQNAKKKAIRGFNSKNDKYKTNSL